jgi:hypothetical protein
MGRELKRVSLDFSWPLGKVWDGYVCPHNPEHCCACDGTGFNPNTRVIYDSWYNLDDRAPVEWYRHLEQADVDALREADRLSTWGFNYDVTAEEINAATAKQHSLLVDSLTQCICVQAKAKREGVFGHCEKCGGEGEIWPDKETEQLAEDWEGIDPPEGEGYQLWETTSEGSPVSPVFRALDELCEWLAPNVSVFGGHMLSKDEWVAALKEEFVYYEDKESGVVFL